LNKSFSKCGTCSDSKKSNLPYEVKCCKHQCLCHGLGWITLLMNLDPNNKGFQRWIFLQRSWERLVLSPVNRTGPLWLFKVELLQRNLVIHHRFWAPVKTILGLILQQHAFCNKAHQSLYMVKCVLTPQVIYKLFGASTLNISKLLNICLNAALQALHAMGSLVAEICMKPLAMPQWTAVCALLNVRGPTNSRKPTSWSLSIGPHLKVCSTSWHYLAMWIGLC